MAPLWRTIFGFFSSPLCGAACRRSSRYILQRLHACISLACSNWLTKALELSPFPLQTALAKPIIQLLAKEHHTRQAVALRPTVGQTLLEGISQSQPQPKIPAEMIKYMGRHVHAWHIAISMLEGHVVLFPTDMRCFDALCHLYRSLAEDDMAFGLWHRRTAADDTRVALALRQHGFLAQAQLQFLELMGRGVSGGIQGVSS